MAIPAPTRALSAVRFATIHHSGVRTQAGNLSELKKRAAAHDRFHGDKSYALETGGEYGFKYISYHVMIAPDGAVLWVQDPKYRRHHATDNFRGKDSHNLFGLAILLEGNFNIDRPTPEALESAAQLLAEWEHDHNVVLDIKAHKEQSLTYTPCPGRYMGTSKTIGGALKKHIIKRVKELRKGPDLSRPTHRLMVGKNKIAKLWPDGPVLAKLTNAKNYAGDGDFVVLLQESGAAKRVKILSSAYNWSAVGATGWIEQPNKVSLWKL